MQKIKRNMHKINENKITLMFQGGAELPHVKYDFHWMCVYAESLSPTRFGIKPSGYIL